MRSVIRTIRRTAGFCFERRLVENHNDTGVYRLAAAYGVIETGLINGGQTVARHEHLGKETGEKLLGSYKIYYFLPPLSPPRPARLGSRNPL